MNVGFGEEGVVEFECCFEGFGVFLVNGGGWWCQQSARARVCSLFFSVVVSYFFSFVVSLFFFLLSLSQTSHYCTTNKNNKHLHHASAKTEPSPTSSEYPESYPSSLQYDVYYWLP